MDKLLKHFEELVEVLLKVKTNIGLNLPTSQPIKPIKDPSKIKSIDTVMTPNPLPKVSVAPSSKKDPVKQVQQIDKDIDFRTDALKVAKKNKEKLKIGSGGQWNLIKEE